MHFRNANLYMTGLGFKQGSFTVEKGLFKSINFDPEDEIGIDLQGAKVLPGLIDTHIHGCLGADFSDADEAGLRQMAKHLATSGVTAFLPTSMTLPFDTLKQAFQGAAKLMREEPNGCAKILGIHMEGPFLSPAKKGAQNEAFLQLPDYDAFSALQAECGDSIRIVDLAPELPGAADFAKKAATSCRVSAAHTEANYDESKAFFDAGADRVTHLFNAMPPLHHRSPGVIAAASENPSVYAELICDGIHVHPAMVRLAFKLFPSRICLISDALRCCGMPNGNYELSGQTVTLEDGVARLESGVIAGAANNLFEDLFKAISFGVDVVDAIDAATIRPAESIGFEKEIGSIEVGKYADFIICDDTFHIKQVFINGESVKEG